jgi:hypothetical protein
MWLSTGIDFEGQPSDRAPFVVFDLGADVAVSGVKIWNYNENHVRDLTGRGAKEIRITGAAAADAKSFSTEFGDFTLARGKGTPVPAETLRLRGAPVRYLKVALLSNHQGVRFPAEGESVDNGFVGLAEVQIVDAANRVVPNVKITNCSSQLSSHQRTASHLLDGSGLEPARQGWNQQGHPFYSAGVAYSQTFTVDKQTGRYVVSLPSWQGSVAGVTVNGTPAGWITAPPYECDISKQVRKGDNTVEVTVIGTLKNTLGPHHGDVGPGSAWPGQFQRGPKPGPPPGERYSTFAYGLFEPFQIKNFLPETAAANQPGAAN